MILTGDLSARHYQDVQQLISQLVNSAANEKHLFIQNPVNIDLSFLQLLASIKKHEDSRGISFTIKTELNDDHLQLLSKSGWSSFLNLTKFQS